MTTKFLQAFGNPKNRTLLLLTTAILILIGSLVALTTRKASPLKTEESRASKIPKITAIPGKITSEKYQALQEEDNRRRIALAKKTGGSAVSTIIASQGPGARKETFGIEGESGIGVSCQCPKPSQENEIPTLDPAVAARLIAQITENPVEALRAMKENPGLAKALCTQKPDLALKIIENNPEAAKIMLTECPAMAQRLAGRNPELFKKLILENPELAKKISAVYPEILKNLMLTDPEFTKKMASMSPVAFKTLLNSDPDLAGHVMKTNPDLIKELMRNDPEFSKTLAKNNPGALKKILLADPEFTKLMATNSPEMLKTLLRNDPTFTTALAESNPTLLKTLLSNDPAFASALIKQNPATLKKMMLEDPEFSKVMARNNANDVTELMNRDPDFGAALKEKNPGLVALLNANRRRTASLSNTQQVQTQQEMLRQTKENQAKRIQDLKLSEQQQKQVSALLTNMDNQTKSMFQAWNDVSAQQFVAGNQKTDEGKTEATNAKGQNNPDAEGASKQVLLKAGSIIFAVLDTAVNTDEPGPIMATIVSGNYKGSKILGEIQTASAAASAGRPEKVILNFSTLSTPDNSNSISIKGVAIDPDSARTALASSVDHHYLLRYGTLFASSFMTGYSKVITAQGTVQTNSGTGTTSTTTPPLTGRKQAFAALGEVGKKFGDSAASFFNTPNTISVRSGTGFGLLILNDVKQ